MLTSMLVFPSMPKGEIVGSCCHWCQWFDLFMSKDWCQVIDWCQSMIGWLMPKDDWWLNDVKGQRFDVYMFYHNILMNMDWCDFIGIWCIVELMKRWIFIVLSWLIRCTNGWTPKWSPYGESPHGKILYSWFILEEWLENPCLSVE